MRIPSLIVISLFFALSLSGCSSSPEVKPTGKTKGQLINQCMDHGTPEACNKQHNP